MGQELLEALEQYVRREKAAGRTPTQVAVSVGSWEAMGRPDLAAGVRVVPDGPRTALPEAARTTARRTSA